MVMVYVLLGLIAVGITGLGVALWLGFSNLDYMARLIERELARLAEEQRSRHTTLRMDLGLPQYSKYCEHCFAARPARPHMPYCPFSYETRMREWQAQHPGEEIPITKDEFYARQASQR